MECNIIYILTILLTFLERDIVEASSWSEWWQYTGVSGFEFWGVINPEWILCQRGKRQSPINVDPSLLLYDPSLKHIRVSKRSASAELENVGQFVRLVLEPGTDKLINITKGPLSYRYTVHEVDFHFGTENDLGSEHMIAGISFPFEVRLILLISHTL
ncbi:DgyrCDS6016 [Dimorphilus gyrociliatus]|uniref:DgyrCDS6016 n=1 Tax=Dimorphilus gyrociliatus TaxID=2664684 RepID=A0A7I8VLS3_9ANNE|nr:DgyrCDS6016 [Dimorphilus gyrociliatus]